jgi:hypothetical protein
MSINTQGYYELRARRERELAEAAADAKIAAIHSEMAERYDVLAAGARPRPTLRVVAPDQSQRSLSA